MEQVVQPHESPLMRMYYSARFQRLLFTLTTVSLSLFSRHSFAQDPTLDNIELDSDRIINALIIDSPNNIQSDSIKLNGFNLTITGISEIENIPTSAPIIGPGKVRVGDGQTQTTFFINRVNSLTFDGTLSVENNASLNINQNQIVNNLLLNQGGSIEIAQDKILTIQTLNPLNQSIINGRITGGSGIGALVIRGPGTAVIAQTLELHPTAKVVAGDQNLSSKLSLATENALGDAILQLNLTAAGVTLAIDAKNALSTSKVLRLPGFSILEVNAEQTMTDLQVLPSKSVKGQPPPDLPLIKLGENGTLLLISNALASSPRALEGEITGPGNLVFVEGAYSIRSKNSFEGRVAVESSAYLELAEDGALGRANQLLIKSDGSVTVSENVNPFDASTNVEVDGDFILDDGISTINSLRLNIGGDIIINPAGSLSIGNNNGDSVIDGTIRLVGELRIGGSGTATINAPIDIGTFGAGIQIQPDAHVVIATENAFKVTPFDISVVRSNLSIAKGVTLDFNVARAFFAASESGWYEDPNIAGTNLIPDGARFNVNASDAIAPTSDFLFRDEESTLSINNVAQVISGQLSSEKSGSGRLEATGNARVTLSGANADFSGIMRLRDSSVIELNHSNALGSSRLEVLDQAGLNLNANVTFTQALRNDGDVGGTGTITFTGNTAALTGIGSFNNPVVIGNQATHAPGNSVGTQTFTNYALDASATLAIEFEVINGALVHDQVVVTGTGKIGENGAPTLTVSGLPSNGSYASLTRYDLITTQGAGGLQIDTLPILQTSFSSPFFNINLSGDADSLWLEIARRFTYASTQSEALSTNELRVAEYLDAYSSRSLIEPNSDLASLFKSLDDYALSAINAAPSDIQLYKDALLQLSGESILTYDAAHFYATQNWSGRLNNYLRHARNSGENKSLNIDVYRGIMYEKNQTNRIGFNSSTYGFIIAAERPVLQDHLLGFAIGYERHSSNAEKLGGSSTTDAGRLALTYAHNPDGNFSIQASAILGYAKIESDRPLSLFGSASRADTDSWDVALQLEGSYQILSMGNTQLNLLGGLEGVRLERNSFNETGSPASLIINKRKMSRLQSLLGLNINSQLKGGLKMIQADARISLARELYYKTDALSGSFVADQNKPTSFYLKDPGFSKNTINLDFGISAKINKFTQTRFAYQGQYTNNFKAHSIYTELMMKF